MPALSTKKLNAMNGAVRTLFFRMAEHLDYEVTHEDFVDLIVPEEHRAFSLTAPEHFHLPYRPTNFQEEVMIGDYKCAFYVQANDRNNKHAPLIPKKPKPFNRDDPKFEPILRYLHEYVALQHSFSLASHTLKVLNDHCGSEQQMRFFWPSMLILMENSGDETIASAADNLRTSKTPKTIPALPEWLRIACRETASTLTTATLIPSKASVPREVSVAVRDVRGFAFMGQRFIAI